MLTAPTLERLRTLRLGAMAAAWQQQERDPATFAELSFDERFGLLVEAEALARDSARLIRLLRAAKLRMPQACIEDIDCSPGRNLDRAVIRQFASCTWVREHQAIVIDGATGTGKTFLACALGQVACRSGFQVLYRRASRLIEELLLARADGSYVRLLDRLAKVDVLAIDDWGLAPLPTGAAPDLLDIIDDRVGRRSIIIASQIPTTSWHDHLGGLTVADAICDRLLHTAHRLQLKGPSRRKNQVPRPEGGP